MGGGGGGTPPNEKISGGWGLPRLKKKEKRKKGLFQKKPEKEK